MTKSVTLNNEDTGMLTSNEETIRLLSLCRDRAKEGWGAKTWLMPGVEVGRHPDSHDGINHALTWAIDLVKRTTLDDESIKRSLLDAAEDLENKAKQLRCRAGSSK